MIMVPLGWFCLMKLFPPEFREIPTSLESIRAELNALGGLNTKEIRTLVVFLTMVTLWARRLQSRTLHRLQGS